MKELNKGLKAVITVCVFVFIIVYFLWWIKFRNGSNNNSPEEDEPIIVDKTEECINFNKILETKVPIYFEDKLPTEEGIIKTATINDMVSSGGLTMEDLSGVGTTCSGNINTVKVGENYYYSYDVKCGECNTNDFYGLWSEWTNDIPKRFKTGDQLEAEYRYNVLLSKTGSQKKYTDWTDWVAENDNKTLPTGLPKDTKGELETETKKQYRYISNVYQWYKISGGSTSYYNNGSYSETQPASGFIKDTNTQMVSRTAGHYDSESALKSALKNVSYGNIQTNTYNLYIYSREIVENTAECTEYSDYTCTYYGTTTTTTYDCTSKNTYTSSLFESEASARSDCQSYDGTRTPCNNIKSEKASAGSYSLSFTYYWLGDDDGAQKLWCRTKCSGYSGTPPSSFNRKSSLINCLENMNVVSNDCKGKVTVNMIRGYDAGEIGWASGQPEVYDKVSPTYAYKYIYYLYKPNQSQMLNTSDYNCTPKTTTTKNSTPTTKTVTTKAECDNLGGTAVGKTCSKHKTTTKTVYLRKDGTETEDRNQAALLTEAEFVAIANSKYKYKMEPTTSIKKTYTATVYKYKWYKNTGGSKVLCNNGNYTSTNPGGCIKDDTKFKTSGDWSKWQDAAIKSTDGKTVETRVLKRMRYSYVVTSSLSYKYDKWLTIIELENREGKKIEELLNDASSNIEKKIYYRYRFGNM